jgi:hypothetical protein
MTVGKVTKCAIGPGGIVAGTYELGMSPNRREQWVGPP